MDEIKFIKDVFKEIVMGPQVCSCTVEITGMGTVIADYFIEVKHPVE